MSPADSPPSLPRDAAAQARLDTELVLLLEQHIRFNQVLGLRCTALRPQARMRFAMRPELVGHHHYNRLHGGVISAALDALGGVALMVAIADRHPAESPEQVMARYAKLGTIDLRVDYLRPGLGSHFDGSAEVLRLGGRVGTTQMRLAGPDGVLVAAATAAYIVS